jgi:hypothetical protein
MHKLGAFGALAKEQPNTGKFTTQQLDVQRLTLGNCSRKKTSTSLE